jgi:hypothetical protein
MPRASVRIETGNRICAWDGTLLDHTPRLEKEGPP